MSRVVHGGDALDLDAYSALSIEPDAVQALRDADYCPEIEAVHSTVSVKDTEKTSHLVFRVRCLTKPIQKADAVKDQTRLWVCDCKGFLFHRMRANPGDDRILPPQMIQDHEDPHVQAVCKHKKAEADGQQETLV